VITVLQYLDIILAVIGAGTVSYWVVWLVLALDNY
jgi:hypothetical protein